MEGATLSLFPFRGNSCSCLQKILVLVFLSIICASKYLETRFNGLNGCVLPKFTGWNPNLEYSGIRKKLGLEAGDFLGLVSY